MTSRHTVAVMTSRLGDSSEEIQSALFIGNFLTAMFGNCSDFCLPTLKTKILKQNTKLNKVNAKLNKVNAKLNKVNTKLRKVITKLNKVNAKLRKVIIKLDNV